MLVAYLLYPRFTALDVVGTFQVLAGAPGMQSVFVGPETGLVIDDTGLCPLTANSAIADLASADVVVVPGSDCVVRPGPGPGRVAPPRAPHHDVDAQRRAPDPATWPRPVPSTAPRPPPTGPRPNA